VLELHRAILASDLAAYSIGSPFASL
jgi:hypothetical protein